MHIERLPTRPIQPKPDFFPGIRVVGRVIDEVHDGMFDQFFVALDLETAGLNIVLNLRVS